MAGHGVHIPFDHDRLAGFPDRRPGDVQRIHASSPSRTAGVSREFRYFGTASRRAPARRTRSAVPADRESERSPGSGTRRSDRRRPAARPPAPPVRAPPRRTRGPQRPQQVIPPGGRKPMANVSSTACATPRDARYSRARRPPSAGELGAKEPAASADRAQQPLPLARPLLGLGALLEAHPRPLRQFLARLAERQPAGPHDEVEHVPAGVAAETIEEPALGIYVERRGLLRVEGAQPLVAAAGPAQRDVRRDHLQDIDPVADLVRHVSSIARPSPVPHPRKKSLIVNSTRPDTMHPSDILPAIGAILSPAPPAPAGDPDLISSGASQRPISRPERDRGSGEETSIPSATSPYGRADSRGPWHGRRSADTRVLEDSRRWSSRARWLTNGARDDGCPR